MASPAGLRVFIDADGAAHGFSVEGFDFMSEGLSTFRYPAGARDWQWNNEGAVTFAVRGDEMAMVLPNVEATGTLRWRAEWYNDQWQVTRRVPAQGLKTSEAAALPDAPVWLDPKAPPISELTAYSPVTLSSRAARDYLDGEWREIEGDVPLPHIQLPVSDEVAPLALRWTDARTGKQTTLQPSQAQRDGQRTRWSGTAPDGSTWWLIVGESGADVLDAVVIVRSDEENCFRLSLGARYPAGEWTWFDDVQFSAPLQKNVRVRFDGTSPYGLTQRRSYYPFGVIASTSIVLVAETDGREPRHFQIEADSSESTLWIHYDLATSPGTEHFPNLATVRAQFRAAPRTEDHPFRAELRSWFERDDAWTRARVPVQGLWMPFTDIGSVANPADFHFAFFEKVGPFGADVDAARANGALTLVYTEPWLYWLPLPDSADWNREAAVRRMEVLAKTAVGKDREFASAGLLGATRDAELQPRMQFMVTPWSTGGRMEVSTDPELPVTSNAPVNRAMAEWRFIRESLDDPRVDGIYLDSMSAMEMIDYNPAAIAVADYPLTFVQADLKPGVAMPVSAVEFTSALAGYLHAHGKYLMGNFPLWKFPFFMPYIDIPGEETTWYSGKRYAPLSERERNYRRAMSGAKPFGFLQATHFADLTAADIEKYFRDCLAQGFLPSFFSHDGANDPYWVDASLYERDRPLFHRYMPLILRLSYAGWQPVPGATVSDARVIVEQFGSATNDAVWLTVRNTSDQPVVNALTLREGLMGRVLYDVNAGRVYPAGAQRIMNELSAHDVSLLLALAPEAVEREAEWFRSLTQHHPLYGAGAANLSSYLRENAAGFRTLLTEDEVAPNDGTSFALKILAAKEGIQFIGWGEDVPVGEAPTECVPGTPLSVRVPAFLVRAGEWSSISWRMSIDGEVQKFGRMIYFPKREDLALSGPPARVIASNGVATLAFSASNRAPDTIAFVLQLTDGMVTNARTIELAPGEATQKKVSVEAKGATSRRIAAQWIRKGSVEAEYETFAIFAPPLKHLGMKPGVRVTSDSAFSGYTTVPLNDGETESAGLMWNEGAFASADAPGPHWVRYQFPAPETVSAVTAYWNNEGGVLYASKRGEVWGQSAEGDWQKLGEYAGDGTSAVARVEFDATPVTAIEWRQPASSGAAARPDILWLVEVAIE